MNGVNNEIENFNVFDYARKTNSYSLLEVAIQNLELYGLHVNSGDKDGNTLLHIISHKGRNDLVQKLIKLGANINITNHSGETPLHLACSAGHIKTVKLLVMNKADVRVKDTKSRSLLHLSIEKNNLELCKYLIDCGINVNCQDQNGLTALHYAIECKLTKIIFLLVHKADVNMQDHDGYTPLHVASTINGELVKFLLRNKASIDIKTFNGDSPLHLAASSGNLSSVAALLTAKSNSNVLNNDHYTPVQLAEMNGHQKVLELLAQDCGNSRSKIPTVKRKLDSRRRASRKKIFSLPLLPNTISL